MSLPTPLHLSVTVNCTDSCNGIFCCLASKSHKNNAIVIYNARDDCFELVGKPNLFASLISSKQRKRLYSETRLAIHSKFFRTSECAFCSVKACPGPLSCKSRKRVKPITKDEFDQLLQAYQASQTDVETDKEQVTIV